MKPLPCPICRSDNIAIYNQDDEYRAGYDAVECRQCNFIAWSADVEMWDNINRINVNEKELRKEWLSD